MSDHQRPGDELTEAGDDVDLAGRIEAVARRQELADPDAGLGTLDRLVNRAVEILGVAALVVIVATIFANAFGRYALNAHLLWAEELVLLALPWLAMTGTFLAVRRGTMIRIEFFYDRMPLAVRRPLSMAGYVLCVAMLVFLGVISSRFVALFGSDASPYLDIPTGLSSIALAIGGFTVAVAFLAQLLREFAAMARKR
ncbi:MAG: TRAP transporter small permease [Gammaproteobacteria bacterium]